jgi:hypothetical protein
MLFCYNTASMHLVSASAGHGIALLVHCEQALYSMLVQYVMSFK